jgi:Kef-type K+ transport system membrane component KefB
VFGLTIGIALLAAEGLSAIGLIQQPFMIALILSTTSLGIVVPVLKERVLIGTRYGQTLLISALIADFGTLVLITVQVAVLKGGLTLNVLLVWLLLVAFAATARLAKAAAGISGLRRIIDELSHATAQIQVRGAVALMVAFIVLSEWLGIEVILGAFLAGVLISLLAQQERTHFLHLKMDAIGFGFFIPIFFIMVGVNFDLPALLSSLEAVLLVPLLLAIAYLIKFAAALLYRIHYSWRETLAAGGLLSARLSLIIAAAAIALKLGAINEAGNAAIILVAVVSCTVSPMLFNRILPAKGTTGRQGVILVGLGDIPVLLAERLQSAGKRVTLIGVDTQQIRRIRGRKLKVIKGEPDKPKVMESAGAASAELLIAVSTYDQVNLAACRLASDTFGVPQLIAQISDSRIAAQMTELGVRVVQPQLATALALEGAVYFPAVFDILANPAEGVEVREVKLKNVRLYGEQLRNIRLWGDALIMGLRRKGEVLVPHGDTKLRQGDLLMLVGGRDSLQRALARLSSEG